MQPKTRYEKEVWDLFDLLPDIKEEVVNKALRNVGKYEAYFHKLKNMVEGTYRCTACGHEWKGQWKKTVICPHCGQSLTTEVTKKKKGNNYGFFVVISEVENWMVARYFWLDHNCKVDGTTDHFCQEIMQIWHDNELHKVVMARDKTMYPSVTRCPFNLWSSFSIKRPLEKDKYYYGYNILDTNIDYLYLENLPKFLAYVDWGKYNKYLAVDMMPFVKKYPMIETILKLGHEDILKELHYRDFHKNADLYLNSIRLAIKNNYQPVLNPKEGELNIWFDMLPQLVRLNKDWHNPFYVCPKELNKVHNKYTDIISEMEALEKAAKMEEQYKKARKLFFGMDIGNENIHIQPLESVKDFYYEWKEMKHCVYSCEYFNMKRHPDSLILSARTGNWHNPTKYLETIEIDIRTFEIKQIHGHCNQDSPRHKEVMKLVKKGMAKVKKVIEDEKKRLVEKAKQKSSVLSEAAEAA